MKWLKILIGNVKWIIVGWNHFFVNFGSVYENQGQLKLLYIAKMIKPSKNVQESQEHKTFITVNASRDIMLGCGFSDVTLNPDMHY